MGRTGAAGGDEPLDADLVAELRDEVARRLPDDVAIRATADGFAVGYPEPLVVPGPDGTNATTLWAHVACDPTTLTFRITDVVRTAQSAPVDTALGRSVAVQRGRMVGDRRAREHGTLPDGTRGVVREQVHSPRLLHAAVREPAAALGWQERQPVSAVVGKVVGITAGAGVVLSGLVIAALALAGRLG